MKKKKILIVDSARNSVELTRVVSVHTRTAYILSKFFDCDLVISMEESFQVKRVMDKKYDVVIFVYASGYVELPFMVRYFAENNKTAKYYFIHNEYDLAENPVLRELCKHHGIKYDVLSNYFTDNDKNIFQKCAHHIDKIDVVNINAIIYEGLMKDNRTEGFFSSYKKNNKVPIIYYGTFRPNRIEYFKKYFDANFPVSISTKNVYKFREADIECKFLEPIKWAGPVNRLFDVKSSLYIEDTFTHTHYNHLANRFYEGLMYEVAVFFDRSCMNTIEKSKYPIDDYFIVDSKKELMKKVNEIGNDYQHPKKLHTMAIKEHDKVMEQISKIIIGE